MRLAWATDIHLNFVDEAGLDRFIDALRAEQPDAAVITGDIGEANDWFTFVDLIEDRLGKPVWFVLGNHDFYRGSIKAAREKARGMRWLVARSVIALNDRTGLVGHDGWGDARLGNFRSSPVFLNDFLLIAELVHPMNSVRVERLRQLGDEAAAHFRDVLPIALSRFDRVMVATHVPPFRGAAWHEGKSSDDDWLPYYSCQAVGDALLEAADANPLKQITVLCGHTHGGGYFQPRANLEVYTGPAEYGAPGVQRCFEFLP